MASLVTLDPADYNKSTALEISAGGRLYNVVVQDENLVVLSRRIAVQRRFTPEHAKEFADFASV